MAAENKRSTANRRMQSGNTPSNVSSNRSALKIYRLFWLIGAAFIIVAIAGIFGRESTQADNGGYTNLIVSLFLGIAFLVVGVRKRREYIKAAATADAQDIVQTTGGDYAQGIGQVPYEMRTDTNNENPEDVSAEGLSDISAKMRP